MATVVNARDALLLAAPSRTEVVQNPGPVETDPHFVIIGSSSVFYVAANGAVSPEAITLKVELRGGYRMSDFPFWSVIVGSATLHTITVEPGDPGNQFLLTRVVKPETMQTDLITVRCRIFSPNADVSNITADFTITKIREGDPGVRGSVRVFVSGQSAWDDVIANNAIATATGTIYRVVGDEVTMHNNGGFAESRQWNGSAWILLAGVLSGSILATGSVPTSALADNSVSAAKLAATIASSNYVAGSSGWQIDKTTGQITLYNGVVRGDVRASSAASGAIDTAALQANAVTTAYAASSAQASHTVSLTVSVPSGAAAMVIDIDPGLYVNGGVTYKAWASFTDNGAPVQAERFTVVGPSAGSHTITATRTNVNNDTALYTRPMHLGVTVIKK